MRLRQRIAAFAARHPQAPAERPPARPPDDRGYSRLADLLDDIDAIVWEAELEPFRFTYVNAAAERILGHPAGRWLDEAGFLESILHETDRAAVLDEIWLAIGERSDHELEARFVAADGTTVWTHIRTRVLEEGSGRPRRLRGIMVDVTRRKLAETALAESEEQLRHAQKLEAVGRLAGGIAHDFNNLLTAISGYTEFLLARLDPDDDRRADALQVLEAAGRAQELTGRLLAFGRRQPLEERVVDLDGVVRGLESLLRRLIGEDVALVVRGRPGALVRVDPGRVEQVVVNLAVNARDAMPEGGSLTIATRVLPGRSVELVITDTGCGMDDEVREHLFEPFFTTKEEGKGTGLGLATVYGIVRQSGGEIAVETAPGEGTTFRITLPRVEETPAEREVPAPVASPAVPRPGSETVLVVEDETLVRRLVREVLERQGYDVLEAENGIEALALSRSREGRIDLLVTDLVMPQLSGGELAERLASDRPGMQVLFLSGYGEAEIAERVGRPEALVLSKPFLPAALAARVRDALDGDDRREIAA